MHCSLQQPSQPLVSCHLDNRDTTQACSSSSTALACLQENQHSKREKEEQHMAELATNAKNDEEVIAKLHKVTVCAGA